MEKALVENGFRFAKSYKDKEGNDRFGFKINLQHFKANDWEADNNNATDDSDGQTNNLGGWDAVNIYGDERGFENTNFGIYPGLGTIHRTGYSEVDLVDYDTENLKFNTAFHYKSKKENEFIYSFNYGEGTTVYQGDNRYSLKDIKFYQNRLEFRKKDKFFIRFYTTHEDAGNSYDAVATATSLLSDSKDDIIWKNDYIYYWQQYILDSIKNIPGWYDWDKYVIWIVARKYAKSTR